MYSTHAFLGKIKVENSKEPIVCGVINLSPESFFKGSVIHEEEKLTKTVEKMIINGAKIIDVGAQSTRPHQIYGGNEKINEKKELERIQNALPIIMDVISSFNGIELSVDTFRASVANFALQNGVQIINDVTGLKNDVNLGKLVGEFNASIVLMASNKEPGDISSAEEGINALKQSINIALKEGISEKKIVIDPGFGGWQGRPWEIDREIFQKLEDFKSIGKPLFVGVSRKSTVGIPTNRKNPNERLAGTIALTSLLIEKEIAVIRAHDVPETIDTIKIVNAFLNE